MTDAPSEKDKSRETDSNDAIERRREARRREAERLEAERKREEEKAAERLRQQKLSKDEEALRLENERIQKETKKDLPQFEIVDKSKQQPTEPVLQANMSKEAMDKAVTEVHDAAFATTLGVSSPDTKKLQNILATANQADRKTIEANYEKQYPGHNLRDDLKTQLGAESNDYARVNALLNRKDGQSDEVGQVQVALARLNNAKGEGIVDKTLNIYAVAASKSTSGFIKNPVEAEKKSAENDIMKTIASLDKAGVEKLMQSRDTNSGKDLKTSIMDNPNISPDCKQAVQILLKGNNRSDQDTLELARIGIDGKRPDIFNIAMQNASPEARKQFKDNDGEKRINESFTGFDQKAARDYLELGRVSFSTLVEGNTHWYHTNQDAISTSVKNASPEEREMYTKGQKLAASNADSNTLEAPDRTALEFYNKAHKALMDARNSDREVVLWESQLQQRTGLEQDMLKTHSDGYLTTFGWNLFAGHKRDDLFKQVENISAEDWGRIKSNRDEELAKLDKSLQSIASEDERKQVMQMLTDKTNAASYDESKTVGRRGIEQVIADGGDKLQAIANMTPQEREQYKNDEQFRNRLDNEAKTGFSTVLKRDVAQYLLHNLDTPEAVKQVLLDSTRTPLEDPAQTVRNIEEAFKNDPTLIQRIKNTEEALKKDKTLDKVDGRSDDVILTRAFQSAVDSIARTADPSQPLLSLRQSEPGILPVLRPANYDDFEKSLWETGKLDLEHRLQLDKFSKDPLAKYKDLASATEEERQQVYKMVPGPDNNFMQITDEEKKLVELGVKQNGFTKVDEYQSTLIAPSRTEAQRKADFEKLTSDLEKMTPAEKQNIANEYFTKTGQLFSVAVLAKAPEEDKWRLRELLSPTDVNVRQIVLDARTERSLHNSVMDNVIDGYWDYSRRGAEAANDNLNKFLIDHKTELDALDPDARKKFDDAVANYKKAEKEYVESKGKLAETFVDATITIAAIGGAVFTGGTSLTLLQAIGVGAAGAAYRTAAMKVIQGSDFDSSAENIARQSFKGSTAALLGFIGPEQLGMKGFVKMGEQAATRVAENTLVKVTEVGVEKTAFKEGVNVAKVITERVGDLKKQMAIMGTKDSEKAIQSVVDDVMKASATPAEREIFATALRNEMKEQAVKSIRDKLITEAESAAINTLTGAGSNVGTEVLSTVVGLDDPNTLFDRMANGAVAGAGGALFFHGVFRVASGGLSKGHEFFVGKDKQGLFAGENTVVRMANGEEVTIGRGQRYYFKEGDKLAVPKEAQDVQFKKGDDAPAATTGRVDSSSDMERVSQTKSAVRNDGSTIEKTDGQITKMVTATGAQYEYKYTNGELSEVRESGNVYTKKGETWSKYNEQTKLKFVADGEYRVDEHGNLVLEKHNGDRVVHETDGTTNKYDSTGHLYEVTGADVQTQTARLESLIDSKLADDPQMQKRMKDWMEILKGREVLLRSDANSLTQSEIAQTMKQVSRLLESDASQGGPIMPGLYPQLAEQIMFYAAHPSLIEQGFYPTCNVTTIQNRTFSRTPSDMAKMIVDVALTGKYHSNAGVVNMSHIEPDGQAMKFADEMFKNGPQNIHETRSLASQIAQETMINSYWQHAMNGPDGKPIKSGTLVYRRVFDPRPNDSGMRITNDKTGWIHPDPETPDSPHLSLEALNMVQARVKKTNDPPHRHFTFREHEVVSSSQGQIEIDGPENLRKALLAAQKDGTLPIIVEVNHTHPLIGGKKAQWRDLAPGEADHVITIRSIDETTGKIEIVNQYDRSHDHILENAVTAEEVFEAMKRTPKQKVSVIQTYQPVQFLDIPALRY